MNFTAIVEHCRDTGLYVAYVPGFAGAHSQGKTLDELNGNLQEVIELLLEEGEPYFESEFVGTQQIVVGNVANTRTEASSSSSFA